MKVKVEILIGQALEWAVATAEAGHSVSIDTDIDGTKRVNVGGMYPDWSTEWVYGGPIIESEGLTITHQGTRWGAQTDDDLFATGPTPLIAAMRCFVLSKLGDTVEIPDELMAVTA